MAWGSSPACEASVARGGWTRAPAWAGAPEGEARGSTGNG